MLSYLITFRFLAITEDEFCNLSREFEKTFVVFDENKFYGWREKLLNSFYSVLTKDTSTINHFKKQLNLEHNGKHIKGYLLNIIYLLPTNEAIAIIRTYMLKSEKYWFEINWFKAAESILLQEKPKKETIEYNKLKRILELLSKYHSTL
ncbi:MAG: hypothetical protein ACPG4Y_09805 [Chitinophagales bacterium]